MVNFSPLAAEIVSGVWGTSVTFNGFRVLPALLHGIMHWASAKLLCGVEQRAPPMFGRATITLGIGQWPTFLVLIYINDLEEDVVSNMFKFADDTKLFRQGIGVRWECRRI